MQNFEDLKVWQKARELSRDIYALTRDMPPEERFGLTNQIRRATVSIAANIAEGSKRRTARDFAHFLNMAEGSCAELRCLLFIAADLAFLDHHLDLGIDKVNEVGRMLYSLRTKIETEGR